MLSLVHEFVVVIIMFVFGNAEFGLLLYPCIFLIRTLMSVHLQYFYQSYTWFSIIIPNITTGSIFCEYESLFLFDILSLIYYTSVICFWLTGLTIFIKTALLLWYYWLLNELLIGVDVDLVNEWIPAHILIFFVYLLWLSHLIWISLFYRFMIFILPRCYD